LRLKKIIILGAILKDNKPLCLQKKKKNETVVVFRQTKQHFILFLLNQKLK
jgi:hypothetical protein